MKQLGQGCLVINNPDFNGLERSDSPQFKELLFMLSKGGKREYLCPECKSPDIRKTIICGQNSGACNNCITFWPWSFRLKVKAK